MKWNTFVNAPQGKQPKAFGVPSAENKIAAASATPLPPIVDSQTTVGDELVKKSPTITTTMDPKTVLPPIVSSEDGDKKDVGDVVKSSSNIAEPLPPITGSQEVKDSEMAEATSGATETAELTMQENMSPLPPITPKQAEPAMQFGNVYFVLGQVHIL